jgi:hypothetical protein
MTLVDTIYKVKFEIEDEIGDLLKMAKFLWFHTSPHKFVACDLYLYLYLYYYKAPVSTVIICHV